jgi:chemotaxis protein MotB
VITVTRLPPELDQALKEFASRYPDAVEYLADHGAVRWKSDLTFGLGSDVVRDSAKSSLREFAQICAGPAAEGFEVVVVGHTDDVPISRSKAQHPTNWHLSVHRSIAVMNELSGFGVPSKRIGVMGYGEFQPAVPNPPSGGNEKNRRVEIFLVAQAGSFSNTSGG